MPDITIGELPQASRFDRASLLVTENQGIAESVTGGQIQDLAKAGAADAAAQAAAAASEATSAAKKAAASADSILGLSVQADTLPPGSEASAEATLIDGHYRITLGLPEGQSGPQGATGPAGPQGEKGETGSGFKVLDYYDTLAALQAAVPNPSVGDAYGVGTADPYDIYIYGATSGWVNNGPLSGGGGGGGAVPDWNQNDESAPDYVKNRTHYEKDPTLTDLIPEQSVSFDAQEGAGFAMSPTYEIAEGATYQVVFDGATYNDVVCKLFSGILRYIGNLGLLGAGEDTGEDFLYIDQTGQPTWTWFAASAGNHTLSLRVLEQEVVPLPEKYLPVASEESYGVIKKKEVILRYSFQDNAVPTETMGLAVDDFCSGKATIHWQSRRVIHAARYESDGAEVLEMIFGGNPTQLVAFKASEGYYYLTLGTIAPVELQAGSVRIFDNETGGDMLLSAHYSLGDPTNRYFDFHGGARIYNDGIVIRSPSLKQFKITVDDSGVLSATAL